jgi:hypothetical protein
MNFLQGGIFVYKIIQKIIIPFPSVHFSLLQFLAFTSLLFSSLPSSLSSSFLIISFFNSNNLPRSQNSSSARVIFPNRDFVVA